MIFYKTVASGNDFLHVDTQELQDLKNTVSTNAGITPGKGALAEKLCQRHTGAGADGVVFYTLGKEPHSPVTFTIFNCDGSEAELSGNGMGGLAALLFYRGLFQQQITLDTRVGQRTHYLMQQENKRFRINIEIGPPVFDNRSLFPFLDPKKLAMGDNQYLWEGIPFYPVSVGNPHVVVIPDREMSEKELIEMGQQLERAPLFPHKTNVEFVLSGSTTQCEGGEKVRVFFYERGVGPTLSSSTGSSAVFAVLHQLGKLNDTLLIDTPNHTPIKITGKGNIYIENWVEVVYKGII